jgi:hypothetical protein
MVPFKPKVATPFSRFPSVSNVNVPTAALGPIPITVPVSETVQLPATVSKEQPLGASAWTTGNEGRFFFAVVPYTTNPANATEAISMAMIRFMSDLLVILTKARAETAAR